VAGQPAGTGHLGQDSWGSTTQTDQFGLVGLTDQPGMDLLAWTGPSEQDGQNITGRTGQMRQTIVAGQP
jgi:CxxC motif-containing protein (DUF1111 family)